MYLVPPPLFDIRCLMMAWLLSSPSHHQYRKLSWAKIMCIHDGNFPQGIGRGPVRKTSLMYWHLSHQIYLRKKKKNVFHFLNHLQDGARYLKSYLSKNRWQEHVYSTYMPQYQQPWYWPISPWISLYKYQNDFCFFFRYTHVCICVQVVTPLGVACQVDIRHAIGDRCFLPLFTINLNNPYLI